MKHLYTAFIIATLLGLTACAPMTDTHRENSHSETKMQNEAQKTTTTTIYLPDKDYIKTVPKSVSIPVSDTMEKDTLIALIRTDSQQKYPLFPKNLTIKNMTIKNDIAEVDFSKDLLHIEKGSNTEELFIAMTVNTLTEFPSIKGVKFLVEGKPITRLTGHNDMTQTFTRDPDTIHKN